VAYDPAASTEKTERPIVPCLVLGEPRLVANIYAVVPQLRGEAGARQVPNPTVGLAHVIGLGSACTIHILPL
jgi:hypothetical protein